MTKWRTFIDPSVGDGQNTINGIIADGPTFGVGISDDLSVTGLSTFSDVARFSSTVRFCLLYTSPSPRDLSTSRMPSSA